MRSGIGGSWTFLLLENTATPAPISSLSPPDEQLDSVDRRGWQRQDRALCYITGHTGMVPDINQELFRILGVHGLP